ncbi:hypothetical protein O7627_08695 [Solwaraspora sp. WMMD1047]|uniref:hypothetical protein n=1 Tax=Solwaraspora sp. WMMD1047 TaxID=3016102 RepID=UPI0024167AEA|nr:hypothetical protein [Solwaraspora sp. WMMD1047]MDG4829382.1 hypothetical protein [Solwaraspora sp. WMMD1047]
MALKTAAFGAVYLVSNADPGVVSLFRESFAASNAIAGSTGLVRDALTDGPLPTLPRDSSAEVTRTVLAGLREAVAILRERAPDEVENYRSVVLAAVDEVAKASRGVHPREAEMIDRVRNSLA